jgi:tetratricopeptide (TPR) repeat protein
MFAESERQKNFKKAIRQCNNLLDLLKKHKVIFRKERVGNALNNLSFFKTMTGDYSSAASDAKKAKEHYIENSFDYNVALEQEFKACFYGKKFEDAGRCIHILRAHLPEDAGEFRISKYIFYQAYVFFALGKFKEALNLLNESLEIEKDKSRWNISVRILHIQLFVELNKIDEALYALESLRKYIERTEKNEEVGERDIMIVRLLREMEKNGFQYDPSNVAATKMLNELSDPKSPLAWQHYTAELIPFQNWIRK